MRNGQGECAGWWAGTRTPRGAREPWAVRADPAEAAGTIIVASESASGPSSARHAESSATKSSIEAKRSPGSFASARSTAAARRGGVSGRRSSTLGAGSLMCFIATATKLSPGKGTSPVRSS